MMYREEQVFRILYCNTALSPGGEQKQMVQILRHLDLTHFQPIVCSIRPVGHVEQPIRDLNTDFLCLNVSGRYNLPKAVQVLRQVIEDCDISLVQVGIFGSEFAGIIAAMIAGIPVVGILETTYDLKTRFETVNDNKFTWYFKWRTIYLAHALLARTAKIQFVALSQAIKESAVRHLGLPTERITVIPLGLNPVESEDSPSYIGARKHVKRELGLNGAYPVLLNVARLSPVKGQKDLILAMPRVLERFPQAKLLIAGDGPLMTELEQTVGRMRLEKDVFLLGHRNDINCLLDVCDLFVFSSYYEGLPGAVIEAMAAERCIVSFDIPPIREVIEDGRSGILVQGRDTLKLAKTIIDLCGQRDVIKTMGRRARQIVKEKYDIKQNMRSLEALYRIMIAGSSLNKAGKEVDV